MAHFARLNEDNIVVQVIVIKNERTQDGNGDEVESIGAAFCETIHEGTWKQTSYNANMRGCYAGLGMTYMENVATLGVASTDIFIGQQPYPSWTIDPMVVEWKSPLGEPPGLTTSQVAANQFYEWDESAYQADTSDPKTVGWILRDDPF
jgi:hypothetical protein